MIALKDHVKDRLAMARERPGLGRFNCYVAGSRNRVDEVVASLQAAGLPADQLCVEYLD